MKAPTALLALLPLSGVLAGCEVLAGIQDITYSSDASTPTSATGSGASSGSSSGTESGAQATGATTGSGSGAGSGTPVDSGSASGSGSGAMAGSTTGADAQATSGSPNATGSLQASGASGGSQSPPDAASDARMPEASTCGDGAACVPCAPATGTLPFVVDTFFGPTGYLGDTTAITTSTSCPARSSATAKGSCHVFQYTPLPAATVPAPLGWAGMFWQNGYNWGSQAGYPIPAGATRVTFWARGQSGSERVTFIVGYSGSPTAMDPCTDSVHGNTTPVTLPLSTAWTQYVITLTGSYPDGVLGAFGWTATPPAKAADGGTPALVFYVDDIEYQ